MKHVSRKWAALTAATIQPPSPPLPSPPPLCLYVSTPLCLYAFTAAFAATALATTFDGLRRGSPTGSDGGRRIMCDVGISQ